MVRTFLLFPVILLHQQLKYLRSVWRRAHFRVHGVRLSGGSVLVVDRNCSLTLAPHVSVGYGSLIIVASDPHDPEKRGALEIGRGTAVNEYCNIRASGSTISIGEQCMLAQFVTLVGTNHGMDLGVPMMDQGWSFSKHGIRIGNDVWLGAHVTVLPGITIGDGAVIAAGAVVNRDVGKNEIWAGIPARKIRSRNESSVVQSSSINTACGGMR